MDELRRFAIGWLRDPVLHADGPGFDHAGCATGIILFRNHLHLVQMWTCEPNGRIREHAHPNADGFAILIAGDMVFTVAGSLMRPRDCQQAMFGATRVGLIAVPAGVKHAARIGGSGGAFLAITRWRDGAPRSVHLDWAGKPLDDAHAAALSKE